MFKLSCGCQDYADKLDFSLALVAFKDMPHQLQHVDGSFSMQALLTRSNGRTTTHDIWGQHLVLHLL